MLKKAISRSRKLAELQTDSARLLYTWLIPHLDIEGRFYGDPSVIRGSIVPRLETYTDKKIIEYLQDMQKVELIFWYEIEGDLYLQFTVFEKHQTLRKDRESQSQIPAPLPDNSGITPGLLPPKIREVKLSKDKNPLSKKSLLDDDVFLEFWKMYPRKQKKKEAREAWIKISPDNGQTEKIMSAIKNQKQSEQWQKENGKFIPLPATWLNGERWEDETTTTLQDDFTV